MSTKTCKACGHTGPLDDFYRDASRKDGYKSRCKACINDGRTVINRKPPKRSKPLQKLPEQAKSFLRDVLSLWIITKRRGLDVTAEDFVSGYCKQVHEEAAIARGKYQETNERFNQRLKRLENKVAGICNYCGKEKIDYSRSRSLCTNCLDNARDRKRSEKMAM